jgi:outer membrane translocation and assembly module TamA
MRTLIGILCCMSVAASAWAAQGTALQPDSPGNSYRLEAVIFVGSRAFSQEELANVFEIPVGEEFNLTAVSRGLERLRQLYSTDGYLNFTAVPMFEVDKNGNTAVLRIKLDDGPQFYYGRLFLKGDETRPGEAKALLRAWATLSGKRYNLQLLSKWLDDNAAFLPKDEEIRKRFLEQHLDSDTHRADILVSFP